jgi:SAM-dependent methyltransferase
MAGVGLAKDEDVPAAPWARFWASGALHSCMGSFGDRYGGSIGAWWQARFASVAAAERVLDIGTGGGPLPLMLVRQAEGDAARLPQVTAIDLAHLRFAWIPEPAPAWREKIDLRTGVGAEALPFEDGVFDLVCSQFGIEYAEPDAAFSELIRVLRLDGRAALVMHAADSVFARVAAEEAGHLHWLLDQSDWMPCVAAMLEPMSRTSTPEGRAQLAGDGAADEARRAFNLVVRALQRRAEVSAVPDALIEARETAFSLFRMAREEGSEQSRKACAVWLQGLRDSLARQGALIDAALDQEDVDAIAMRFRDSGRDVRVEALRHDDGRVLAWGLLATPADIPGPC